MHKQIISKNSSEATRVYLMVKTKVELPFQCIDTSLPHHHIITYYTGEYNATKRVVV